MSEKCKCREISLCAREMWPDVPMESWCVRITEVYVNSGVALVPADGDQGFREVVGVHSAPWTNTGLHILGTVSR